MYPHNTGNNASTKPLMMHGGTAKESRNALPIGLMDIGISEEAYLFRVSLPGIQKNECNVKCEIKRDGTVYVRGDITPDRGGVLSGSMGVCQSRVQQLSSSGPFTLSFKLPGPVDPRLFAPDFRGDGVLEGVVMKLSTD